MTFYRTSIFIFLFSLVAHFSIAQPAKRPDLVKQLATHPEEDIERVELLIRIARQPILSIDLLKAYSKEALELSKKLGYKAGEAGAYQVIGRPYYIKGEADSALYYFTKSYEIYQSIGHSRGMIQSTYKIGTALAISGRFTEALEHYLAALKVYEEEKQYHLTGIVYNHIGTLYQKHGEIDLAISNFKRSIDAYSKSTRKAGNTQPLSKLAQIYEQTGNYKEALSLIGEAFRILEIDERGLVLLYITRGRIHVAINDFKAAKDDFIQAIDYTTKTGQRGGRIQGLIYLADAEYIEALYNDARGHALEALYLTHSSKNKHENQLVSLLQLLAKIEKESGNYQQSTDYLFEATALSDSLYKEETLKAISEIQTKYETEKKEQEIVLLEAKAESARLKLMLGLGTAFGILIIISIVYWLVSKRKAKEKELELSAIQRELSNYGVLIAEKDSFLTGIIDRLRDLGRGLKTFESKKKLNSVVEELNHNTKLTDSEEQLFQRIEQVNSGFFIELDNRFKELSKSEKRLASLVQMGLSNKEIAGILQIDPRSVVQARYRLKKKMNLSSEESLTNYLKMIGA